MFSASKTKQAVSGGITFTKSLRFRKSATAYLNRTPASAGNRQKWTYSAWIKRGNLTTAQMLLSAGTAGTDDSNIYFDSDYHLYFTTRGVTNVSPAQIFVDPSAWYHIVVAIDTTLVTSTDRVQMYINGIKVTNYPSNNFPSQNLQTAINNNVVTYIGRRSDGYYLDGYMTDVYFIDGQQLTASSFGATDATTGVWQPIAYTGTYGTNGFHLPFTNTTSTTTLGYDTSGNSNNWTTNNISLTAGSTYDSMNDVPTLTSATTANYATLNPLQSGITLSNGNLSYTSGATNTSSYSTIGVSSGKWYVEAVWTATGSTSILGVALQGYADQTTFPGKNLYSYGYEFSGYKYNNNLGVGYGATWANGDVISVALDLDAGTIIFYKNGASQGTAFTGLQSGTYFFGVGLYNSTGDINFGQRPFSYTPPSGYVALNTYNLPTPTIVNGTLYMDASLYTGNRTARSITNPSGFKPDFVWIKARNSAEYHTLTDSVRGINSQLFSDRTAAQESNTDAVTSFNSNGFSLGTNSTGTFSYVNQNGSNYVAWQWQAGQGSTSTNTQGNFNVSLSVNATCGFSIAKGTLPSSGSANYGHGLGVAPAFIFAKNTGGTSDWFAYHQSNGFNQDIRLNTTAANSSTTFTYNSATSSVVTIGGSSVAGYWGGSTTWVFYNFAEIAGFSKFGSYTGNGSSTGPFIYCGFQPKFVIIKRTVGGISDWSMLDSSRNTYNSLGEVLNADTSGVGNTYTALNFLSNGFNLAWSDASMNASGSTYIYAAFASNPFKYSLAY